MSTATTIERELVFATPLNYVGPGSAEFWNPSVESTDIRKRMHESGAFTRVERRMWSERRDHLHNDEPRPCTGPSFISSDCRASGWESSELYERTDWSLRDRYRSLSSAGVTRCFFNYAPDCWHSGRLPRIISERGHFRWTAREWTENRSLLGRWVPLELFRLSKRNYSSEKNEKKNSINSSQ